MVDECFRNDVMNITPSRPNMTRESFEDAMKWIHDLTGAVLAVVTAISALAIALVRLRIRLRILYRQW